MDLDKEPGEVPVPLNKGMHKKSVVPKVKMKVEEGALTWTWGSVRVAVILWIIEGVYADGNINV